MWRQITAAAGAYILNFVYDDKESVYHSLPVTWQKTYGYNKLFDKVFRVGSNMSVEDNPYSYNNKKYVLWMWKGDYWNRNPVHNKQWWITAFDWRHPKPDPKKLVTLGKVDFGDKIGMAQTIRDEIKTRSKDKKIFQDTILSENSNTIWIMWGGNE